MAQFKPGQTVRYKPVGGMISPPHLLITSCRLFCSPLIQSEMPGPDSNTSESVGKIMGVLTEPGQQAGRNVQASEENPRYEVRVFFLCSLCSQWYGLGY